MSGTRTRNQNLRLQPLNLAFGNIPQRSGGRQDESRLGRHIDSLNESDMQQDPSSIEPSEFAQTSSLMVRDVPRQHYASTCWMEPLGFCADGLNRNGWCSWHVHHLFNGQLTNMNFAIVNGDQIEVVRQNRLLTYIPMPFRTASVYVFPFIELFNNLQALKDNLNFSMLQFTLERSKKYTAEQVSRIVALHKAYFIQMIEASTLSSDISRKGVPIDPIVRLNTEACVNYVSDQLLNKDYRVHVTLSDGNDNNKVKHINLHKCTTLTQSIVLMFELAYAFAPEMNVCLSVPPSFGVYRGQLVADQARMSLGTYILDDGSRTYGTPCNLSMFRYDTNGELAFHDTKYKRSAQKCVSSVVDERNLVQYLYKDSENDDYAADDE